LQGVGGKKPIWDYLYEGACHGTIRQKGLLSPIVDKENPATRAGTRNLTL